MTRGSQEITAVADAMIRVVGNGLGVLGAQRIRSFRHQVAVGIFHDNVWSVVAETAIQIVVVIRIDRCLGDLRFAG